MPVVTTDPKEALFALLHPIFRDCCDEDNDRYDLSAPFVSGGFVYATDGRIIARTPATPEIIEAAKAIPRESGRTMLKKPESVFEPSDFLPDPFDFDTLPELDTCGRCHGSGVHFGYECEECGHESDGGDCPLCRGFGVGVGFSASVDVGPHRLSHYFALLLGRHGAELYLPASPGEKRSLKFTIGPDVEGRVMPMRHD